MSFIAAALAKSKGKEVHPPPQDGLLPPPGSEMPMPPAVQEFPSEHPFEGKKKKGPNLKLILAVGGMLLVVGIVVAVKLMSRPAPPPPKPAVTSPAKTAPAPEAPKPAATTTKPATAPAKPVAATPTPEPAQPAVAAPVVPKPTEELLAMVHKFNVSAVMSGPNGRARIDGKTYQVGDAVNADLTLIDIRDGQLYFKDGVGAIYTKRF